MSDVAARLKDLDITLPTPAASIANYVPTVRTMGPLVFVSGQLPLVDGTPSVLGRLGEDVTLDAAYEGARQCGINILAQMAAALGGDLDRVVRCAKVTGFVACTPSFLDHPKVVNGASDLVVEVFGERGRHSRSAVGVSSLPLGAAVEVEAVFEVF